MQSVLVNKDELLTKIKVNRDGHRAIFEEALEGYHLRVIELLEEAKQRALDNKRERITISIPYPEDHTDEYDTIISMLEMSLDEEIDLEAYDFQCYVLDKWVWKKQFLTSNSMYSATAIQSLNN